MRVATRVAPWLALLLTACAGAHPGAGERSPTPTPATTTMGIEASLGGGESLVPAPTTAHPHLSALQAWDRYAARNGARRNRDRPPAGSRVYLALFTGSGVADRLVWAYRLRECNPPYTWKMPTPPLRSCVGWLMLDANTSYDYEMTWVPTANG